MKKVEFILLNKYKIRLGKISTVFNTNLSGLCQILLKNQDRQIKTFLKLQTDFKF